MSAGGKYNPTNGFCETQETDRTVSLNRGFCTELSCQAQIFQSMFQDCYDTLCLDVNSKCLQPQNQCIMFFPDVFNINIWYTISRSCSSVGQRPILNPDFFTNVFFIFTLQKSK